MIVFRGTYDSIVNVAGANQELDAKSLLDLRRFMSEQLKGLSELVHHPSAPPTESGLRQSFLQLRTMISEHQAKWPAVVAKDQRSQYAQS